MMLHGIMEENMENENAAKLEKEFKAAGYSVTLILAGDNIIITCNMFSPLNSTYSMIIAGLCSSVNEAEKISQSYAQSAASMKVELKIKGNLFYFGSPDAINIFENCLGFAKVTMQNKVFGEVSFDTGTLLWETQTEIILWNKKNKIFVRVEADSEGDDITPEQEKLYQAFKETPAEKIEGLLNKFYKDLDFKKFYPDQDELIEGAPGEFLAPTEVNINSQGECAMLFDDKNDEDNGIAVILFPEEKVMTQDEYL